MKPSELFRKTMPFCIAKLVLGGATVLIAVILLAVLMGLGWLFGEGGILIGLLLWLGAIGVIRFAIMHYAGYLVKAGHVAVLAEAVTTGAIPANQVQFGKQSVKERFATANVYFAVDKLVTGAVKQIQRKIGKLENALSFIPGMETIGSLAKFYVELSLGYIDECCLGYTVYRKDQGAFQSACDGVVIYAQNIGKLLKSSAMTMLKVLLLMAGIILCSFVPVGLIFRLLGWSPLAAFLLALLIAWTVKFALVDSYILCQTMASYMTAAQGTQITFDLYGMLSGISADFKKLWEEGRKETPAQPAYADAGMNPYGYPGQGMNLPPQDQAYPTYMPVQQGEQAYQGQAAYPAYAQDMAPPAPPYAPPEQAYQPPAPPYAPPEQAYQPPAPPYAPPEQAYQPPAQPYAPPEQAYQPPAQPYAPPGYDSYGTQPQNPPAMRRRRSGAEVFCPQCGTANAQGSAFCGACGVRLTAE